MKETNREYISSGERKYISLKVILESMKKMILHLKLKLLLRESTEREKLKIVK